MLSAQLLFVHFVVVFTVMNLLVIHNLLVAKYESSNGLCFNTGTRQHRTLDNIIRSPFLLRDVGMLSPDVQTACLESYHSVVCHFAPKFNHFTYPVMEAKYVFLWPVCMSVV